MTELNEFIRMINIRPSYLIQVDWKEETDGLNCKRMMYIIKGIKDDEVCNMVKDYIVTSWYEACNEFYLTENDDDSLFNSSGGWRYVPIEDAEEDEYEMPTIDDVIKDYMDFREKAIRHQSKKQALNARAKEIETSLLLANKSHGDIEAFISNDLFANHYYHECKRLSEENEQLKEQLRQSEKKNKELKYQLGKLNIHQLVEEMISYAEKFTSRQNERAAGVKETLMSKMVNGIISDMNMDADLRHRLTNLGRKEPIVDRESDSRYSAKKYPPIPICKRKEPSLLACIEYLMDEKDKDGGYLVNKGIHWIAIFRIFVDKNLGVSNTDYLGFCMMMKGLKPEGFRIPLKQENLKRISDSMYTNPFEKWRYDVAYNSTRKPYDKMVAIATRFKEILEENGF